MMKRPALSSAGVCLSAILGGAMLHAGAAAADECPAAASAGEAVVIAGTDADNRIRLADGRLVILAGLDTAALRLPVLTDEEATLVSAGPPDRHGAVHADLVVEGLSLSEDLVSEGQARIRPRPGESACYAPLLAAEDIARRAGIGLWADEAFAVLEASDADAVSRSKDAFALVSGRVSHVGTGDGTVWIDFGATWSTGVALVVPRRQQARFAAAGLALDALVGQRVRARGVVTLRGGPRIEVSEPAAIERLDRPKD